MTVAVLAGRGCIGCAQCQWPVAHHGTPWHTMAHCGAQLTIELAIVAVQAMQFSTLVWLAAASIGSATCTRVSNKVGWHMDIAADRWIEVERAAGRVGWPVGCSRWGC